MNQKTMITRVVGFLCCTAVAITAIAQGVEVETPGATIRVGPDNPPPVADDQSVDTDEDVPLPVTLTATDPNGDAITYHIDASPANPIRTPTGRMWSDLDDFQAFIDDGGMVEPGDDMP